MANCAFSINNYVTNSIVCSIYSPVLWRRPPIDQCKEKRGGGKDWLGGDYGAAAQGVTQGHLPRGVFRGNFRFVL